MVFGPHKQLGSGSPDKGLILEAMGNGFWSLRTDFPDDELEYQYALTDQNGSFYHLEVGGMRYASSATATQELILDDTWRSDSSPEAIYQTAAFTKALMRSKDVELTSKAKRLQGKVRKMMRGKAEVPTDIRLRFRLESKRTTKHQVSICGNIDALGNWKAENMLPMVQTGPGIWEAELLLKEPIQLLSYKYVLTKSTAEGTEHTFEAGDNRPWFLQNRLHEHAELVKSDFGFNYADNGWRGAGVAIPVFALRSNKGAGVGEFTDIKLLVDWARQTRLQLVQVLPINDTVATHTWTDSYPYAAISVFALHPMYANMQAMGTLKSTTTQAIIDQQREVLNAKPVVDYEGVMKLKLRFFRLLFDQEHEKTFAGADFKSFFKKNSHWLQPYAAYCYLRDLFNTPNFNQWGEYSSYSAEAIEALTDAKEKHHNDIALWYFIQYHLHKQLIEATEYARENSVVLKGDIPIGIYRFSVDAWTQPHLYNMGQQAGAPPDGYSAMGQNWRFPTYNWGEMAKDGYSWWRNRLQHMATYFDAYRIDHILGFFRIWQIPTSQTEGLMGYFNPAIPLHRHEFEQQGVWFDYDRFCKPYIRDYNLNETLGHLAQEAREYYLDHLGYGVYQFKESYNTQRKVEDALALGPEAPQEQQAHHEQLRKGLKTLHGEVLLFEVEGTGAMQFHPRNAMHFTRSYQALDPHAKHVFDQLYAEYFYHRQEGFWRDQAMVKLPAIKEATNMLVCGEDLGMVPACVPGVMDELKILSLEIQRMPKDSSKGEFSHPSDAPYLSVVSPSCHDMSTIRGWWEEDHAQSQRFYNTTLGKPGEAPYFCEPWLVNDINVQHMYSPAMWAIFPLQDLVGMNGRLRTEHTQAERINEPSNPNHYWRYRFHLPIEQLLEEADFNKHVAQLVQESGRA